jgi:taurine dioxygenase
VLAEQPEVMRISNVVEDGRHIGNPDAGVLWHSDGAYLPVPSMYTLLHCLEIPEQNGKTLGNTLFASTAAAWEALPDERKRVLAGLRARHSLAHEYDQKDAAGSLKRGRMTSDEKRHVVPEVVHPLVRTHPLTARKCLYLSEAVTIGIEGMEPEAARALIDELNAWCSSDAFVYRHQWQVGDFVFWDNCPTKHRALFDYELPQRRLMHRTTVAGTVPF